MIVRFTAILALAAAAMVAAAPERAHACSCMIIEQPQAFEQSVSIFEGHVTSVEAPADPHGAGEVRVVLDVVRTWKGADAEQIEVVTASNSAACGYNFEQGKSYLVYTSAGEADGPELVSLCSRTAPMDQPSAAEDVAAMGEGVTPASPVDPGQPTTGGEEPAPTPTDQGEVSHYEAGCASCAVGSQRAGEGPALLAGALLAFALLLRRRR